MVVDSAALLGFPYRKIAHLHNIGLIDAPVQTPNELGELAVAVFNIGYVIGEREREELRSIIEIAVDKAGYLPTDGAVVSLPPSRGIVVSCRIGLAPAFAFIFRIIIAAVLGIHAPSGRGILPNLQRRGRLDGLAPF